MVCANRTVWVVGLVLVVGVGMCLSIGCGSDASYEGRERAAVTGTVTFNGAPVLSGSVSFVPGEGGRRSNGMIENGSYSISEELGPNLGSYQVQILGYDEPLPKGEIVVNEEGEEEEEIEDEPEEGEEGVARKQILPAKYNYQTTLQVEITSGRNTHDFDMTSE